MGSVLPHRSGPHVCSCSLRQGRNHPPFPQPSLLAGVSHVPCFHSPDFSKRSQGPSLASWEWDGASTFPQFSSPSARATQRHPPPSATGLQAFEEDQPVHGYFLLYSGHRAAWGLPSSNSKYTPVFLDLTAEVPQLQGWPVPPSPTGPQGPQSGWN